MTPSLEALNRLRARLVHELKLHGNAPLQEDPPETDGNWYGFKDGLETALKLVDEAIQLADPTTFKTRLRAVYVQTKSIPLAAKQLGISERSLHRYLAKFPDLKKDAQAGRPRGVDGRVKRESRKRNHPKENQP